MEQSDDSESEAVLKCEPAEQARFRVRVCARRLVSDERALCYVSVSGARRVLWLERRVRCLLGLRGGIRLASRGHWLPPDEPLAPLLAPDDPVDVIPINDSCKEGNNKDQNETVKIKKINVMENTCHDLYEHKRRALLLLERLDEGRDQADSGVGMPEGQLGGSEAGTEAHGGGGDPCQPSMIVQRPRRRRLRCRRRRPRVPMELSPARSPELSPAESPVRLEGPARSPTRCPSTSSGIVMRNSDSTKRDARLVRALI